jgi:hypothetical protein
MAGPIRFSWGPILLVAGAVGGIITLVVVGPVWWIVSWVWQHIQWVP